VSVSHINNQIRTCDPLTLYCHNVGAMHCSHERGTSNTKRTAGIRFVDTTIEISTAISVLGIIIDRHLAFDDHLAKVVNSCNYHIHVHAQSLRHIHHLIDRDITCLVFLPQDWITVTQCCTVSLSKTFTDAVCLELSVCAAPYRSLSGPLLRSLRRLSVKHRITYSHNINIQGAFSPSTGLPLPIIEHVLFNSSAAIA